MASGGEAPYWGRNRSCNYDDVEDEMRRYNQLQTLTLANSLEPQRCQEEIARFAGLQLDDDGETSSLTRQRLAEVEAEIKREEDSATVVRSFSRQRSRDQLREKEKKLKFIQARKDEISQLLETLKHSQTVDLCFLIDCTGSMDPYITEVKMKIKDLIAHCKMTFADLDLRVAFVGYRDHCDAERIISLPFDSSIDLFISFVSNIHATGGGDAAEDVFGGLAEAGKLHWSAPTRILFHIADAPCHGRQYHDDSVLDFYPNGDPTSLYAQDLLNNLEKQNIKYWFARLCDKTDKMIDEFKKLLRMPAAMLHQIELHSVKELMSAVADSVSSSIRDMETATLAQAAVDGFSRNYDTAVRQAEATPKHRSLKKFEISKRLPDWSITPVENARVIRHKLPDNVVITDLLKQKLEEECRKRVLQIAPQPFAEGTQRIVYYGIDRTYDPAKKVFKEFKYLGEGLNKIESYKQQMEVQTISFVLSREFNKQKPFGAKDILFTKVVVVSLLGRPKPFYCSQEPLIEGSYVKFTSNCGFVNNDEYAASLNAFSHWTYHVTNGDLMVVDLQGVKSIVGRAETKFILTDPVIHCKDVTRFCSTNLGKDGMHRFFRTHHCNSICEAMKLTPHRHQPATKLVPIESETVVHA